MHNATIVKDKNGQYHIRIHPDAPQTGGNVKVIEVLQQKDGESLDQLKERALKFVQKETE